MSRIKSLGAGASCVSGVFNSGLAIVMREGKVTATRRDVYARGKTSEMFVPSGNVGGAFTIFPKMPIEHLALSHRRFSLDESARIIGPGDSIRFAEFHFDSFGQLAIIMPASERAGDLSFGNVRLG